VKKSLDLLVEKFFPHEEFRPHQREAIRFAYETLVNREIGLLSSPCGTGKSVSVLTAFFAAREVTRVGKLFALTRTKNQFEIYCRELKRIREHAEVQFAASMFKSKQEMCALKDPQLVEASYRDFVRYCKALRRGSLGRTCEFYEATYARPPWRPSYSAIVMVSRICGIGPLLPDEVSALCRREGLCPYEVTKILARYAEIIVGSYNYLLVEPVRDALLDVAKVKLSDINSVFDEAHSLPLYAADILSDELSTKSMEKAGKEAEEFGLKDRGVFAAVAKEVEGIGRRVYEQRGIDYEKLVEEGQILEPVLKEAGLNRDKLPELLARLSEAGEKIRDSRARSGDRPVSYVGRCADFLLWWFEAEGEHYVRYVRAVRRRGEVYPRLGIKCIDPSVAAAIINKVRSSILMSGTLWHMDYYTEVLGLHGTRVRKLDLPNPFPPENRLILVDEAVTTKYERRGEAQWQRIASRLEGIVHAVKGRVAVYFPSYEVMEAVLKKLKPDYAHLVEDEDTKVVELLEVLRSRTECTVFGVARGKISEGIDASEEGRGMLSAVISVGLPYPKKTELHDAIVRFYKRKFGRRAFEYANDVPCVTAIAQSAGRLIRGPEDRGVIIVMDSRMVGKIRWKFPEDWRREMKFYVSIERLLDRVEQFLSAPRDPTAERPQPAATTASTASESADASA